MAREWAYGLAYRTHRHRNNALPHWLDNYNTRRPHSSIGDRPPISRVHNVRGWDNRRDQLPGERRPRAAAGRAARSGCPALLAERRKPRADLLVLPRAVSRWQRGGTRREAPPARRAELRPHRRRRRILRSRAARRARRANRKIKQEDLVAQTVRRASALTR
jgi:hypothetical protein